MFISLSGLIRVVILNVAIFKYSLHKFRVTTLHKKYQLLSSRCSIIVNNSLKIINADYEYQQANQNSSCLSCTLNTIAAGFSSRIGSAPFLRPFHIRVSRYATTDLVADFPITFPRGSAGLSATYRHVPPDKNALVDSRGSTPQTRSVSIDPILGGRRTRPVGLPTYFEGFLFCR